VALRATIVRSLAAVAWTEVWVRGGRRRDREREGSRQQHGCDLLAHFFSSFFLPTTILSGPAGRRNEPLDPKTMQARESVPSQGVPLSMQSDGCGEGGQAVPRCPDTAGWLTAKNSEFSEAKNEHGCEKRTDVLGERDRAAHQPGRSPKTGPQED
jgi:hypothetical protein